MSYRASWRHERIFRRPKREDRRSARTRDGQEPSRPHFCVSLSSVKRYAKLAEDGRSLAPKKRPGSKPKLDERASKLLEADLKECPFITLQQRCEYLRAVASVEVSRSTVCRAIKRMNATRKMG
jgi:transposase